ncbi:MAG: hypothetical protein ACOC2U_04680 [bacterium]
MKKAIALVLFVFVLTIGTALTVSADNTTSDEEYFNAYSLDTVEPESTCSYYCSWCEATDYGCDAYGNCC